MSKLAPESIVLEETKSDAARVTFADNDAADAEQLLHLITNRQHQETNTDKAKWTLLFKRLRFFPRYDHFIQIDVLSQEASEHNKWLKNVETKLQKLADAIYK